MNKRIFLSPPHIGDDELHFIRDAFDSNYIAPVGPQIDAFEQEFASHIGVKYAAAVSSGTAALHLLLKYIGIKNDDDVFCSTFTFVASANPILYCGGTPVFVDSNQSSWNMNPELLKYTFEKRATYKKLPKAIVLVHLYGQPADIGPIKEICNKYDIILLEDAAEALGAKYNGKSPGTFGLAGFFSFNGNKIITTSGGGMIVSDNKDLIQKVKFFASQAREPENHYEHREVGYNYRMSNILAAIGRGQLRMLQKRVESKRKIFEQYYENLKDLPGIEFMPEPGFAFSTRWLSCLTIDPRKAGLTRDDIIRALDKENIESRPTWKPMHLQPLFRKYEVVGGHVSEELFKNGLCLPSGTSMTFKDQERVNKIIRNCWL